MQMIYAESLQVLHLEMLQQFLFGRLVGKHPVVQLKGKELRSEIAFKVVLTRSVKQYLLRLEVAQQLLHIVVSALTSQELTRGNIQESHTTSRFPEVNGRQEVILLVVQYVIAHGHTRSNQFCDSPLHQFLGEFRIFQLVTYRHSLTCSDQFRQIGVEGMMRETGHLVPFGTRSIVTVCQGDTQDSCCDNGIIAVGFVEVTATKQQQSIRMLRLQVEELFHHRSEFLAPFIGHVLSFCYLTDKNTKIFRTDKMIVLFS